MMKPRLKELPVLGRDGFHRLAYAEWGSPRADRTIVCVHGVSRTGRDFDVLAAALAEQGARVVAPDLPGRGRSEWLSAPTRYTDRAYLRAMATLIGKLDVQSVDWLGTSLGGHIGMLMAAQPGTPVERLILNDFGARVAAASLRRIGGYLGKRLTFSSMDELEAHLRSVHASFGSLRDEHWKHLARQSAVPDGAGGFRMHFDPAIGLRFAAPSMLDVVLWPLWELVDCPVLILRGAQSDLLAADTVAEMTRRGRAGRAGKVQAIEFEGCGHAPALMDAEQIEVIKDFFFAGGPDSSSAPRASCPLIKK
jgi:pimeloyl-ACP methyl ester carboxylesterase